MESNNKKWYASKTIWAVIFTLILAVVQAQGIELPQWVIPALLSAGLLFGRTGKKEIK